MKREVQRSEPVGKTWTATCCLLLVLFGLVPNLRAEEKFHNALSLQGFTGILNTPNAEVTEEGKGYFLYSRQQEPKWRRVIDHEDNYILSLGLFPYIEASARFMEAPRKTSRYISDLSGNFKAQVPFIPRDGWLPQIAFGVQDVTGGQNSRDNAQKLKTWYGVATKDLWFLRMSAGYGAGPDRMEGLFGGVEAKAVDWLYVLGEYDTKETNVGLRLVTPDLFGYPVNLQVTVKTSLDYKPERPEFAFGLQFPLGFNRNNTTPVPKPVPPEPAATASAVTAEGAAALPPSNDRPLPKEGAQPTAPGTADVLHMVRSDLVAKGFQNVLVGRKGSELLVVEYENNLYNHNELDGLGVVLGTVLKDATKDFSAFRLVMKKKGIRVLQITAPSADLRAFMEDAAKADALRDSLRITPDCSDDGEVVYEAGDGNASWLTSSLVLYPGLKTYLGTEISSLDYLISIKPELFINTWKGAVIDARGDIPVLWSSNFDNGKAFHKDRNDSQLDRLMLFQALKITPTVMGNVGAGMVVHNLYGTLNELMWTPGSGDHRFRALQMYGEGTGGTTQKEAYVGTYRYFYAPLDTYIEGAAGKFFTQDKGVSVELRRFFGDTAVTLYYKNGTATDGRNHQAGGIQFELPLTPRRDMKPGRVQLRGTEDFSYAQETEIARKGNLNYLGTSIGVKPEPAYNLSRVFYNRDRLSDGYIREHLLRLRDAWLEYGVKAEDGKAGRTEMPKTRMSDDRKFGVWEDGRSEHGNVGKWEDVR